MVILRNIISGNDPKGLLYLKFAILFMPIYFLMSLWLKEDYVINLNYDENDLFRGKIIFIKG